MSSLNDIRPTSVEMNAAERFYEGVDFAQAYEDEQPHPPERSPLDVATRFLADHQVVELIESGAEPLFTISALRAGDRIVVIPTVHGDNQENVRVATYAVLNACRAVIDGVDGEGEAVKALFCMAAPPREPGQPEPEPDDEPDPGSKKSEEDA